MLLHIEFQRNHDSTMAERVWEYNQKADLKYKCPVWSVVIYLKNDGKVVEAPLIRELPNGRLVHHFDFEVIKLWEVSTQEFKQKGLSGLLPLLPLTREGQSREVVEEVIVELSPPDEEPKTELLALTYGLASLAFENQADQNWLSGRFNKMYDILRDTPAFQDLARESRKEGLQQGLQQGLQIGKQELIQELRQTAVEVVLEHFPKLARLAKKQLAVVDNPLELRRLIVKISVAKNAEEAREYLLELDEEDE